MKNSRSSKIRDQLEASLRNVQSIKGVRPRKGYIRSMREALGMSGRQLAERLEVEAPRIPEMEKAEVIGKITLRSLQRAAAAMGCQLAYAFLPDKTLEATLHEQAAKVAKRKLKNVGHTMRLEEQGLPESEDAKLMERMVDEWIKDPPRWLWDTR